MLLGGYVDALILIGSLVVILYYYSTWTYDYWKRRGVPHMKPLPLIGNSRLLFVRGKKHTSEDQVESYEKFNDQRFFGRYNFKTPVLVVRDPDLVEAVLIRDFSNFRNRGFRVDHKLDKLSLHLVNLRDGQWKYLRNKLTPVFSSGKLKSMLKTLIDCTDSLNEILDSTAESGESLSAKKVMGDFSTYVIGHCAFGLNMNTLKNPDSQFRKMAKVFFRPTPLARIRVMIRLIFPRLLRWLNWKALPKKMEDFFIGIIKDTESARQNKNIEVPDFLQLLINLKKGDAKLIEQRETENIAEPKDTSELLMDDTLMTANALIFFLAGYETISSTLSFCLFELARDVNIQEDLRHEIQRITDECNGTLSLDAIKEMTLLDQVVMETLRLYPPACAVPRECTQDWKIPGTDVIITKGTIVQIPIFSLHRDSQYYPEPERFLPERFAKENLSKIRKGTYLPFGDGPRICIGNYPYCINEVIGLTAIL